MATLDPSILSAIQAAANKYAQQSGSYDWTSLLGSYNDPSKPLPFGTATLPAEQAAGMMTNSPFAGQPTLQAQLAGGTFGPNMGYLSGLQNTTQEGISGRLNPPTNILTQGGLSQYVQPGTAAANQAGAQSAGFGQGESMFQTNEGPVSLSGMRQALQGAMGGNWAPGAGYTDDQVATEYGQYFGTPVKYVQGSGNAATLQNMQDYASQFGQSGQYQASNPNSGAAAGSAAGSPAAGGAPQYTLASQSLYGNSNGAAGGGNATLAAKQQAGNFIQNAAAGAFANPFTYQAKLQGLNNAGALGGIMGNNLQQASGQSMQSLQNTPNLTNVQLGTDLANAQVGKPISPLTQNFLSSMLGVPQQANAGSGGQSQGIPGDPYGTNMFRGGPMAGQTAVGAGGQANSGAIGWQVDENGNPVAGSTNMPTNPADGGTTVYGGTHYHLPNNPLTSQNPGGATPLQEFNYLDPSSQQAYIDLQQNMPNGQTSQDFMSQMKGAAPSSSFKPSAFATSGI